MMSKIVLEKDTNGFYKLMKPCDILYPLYIFLTHDVALQKCIEFLEDVESASYFDSVVHLTKKHDNVAIKINDTIMPGLFAFTLNQKLLARILSEYVALKDKDAHTIEVCFGDREITVTGS